MLTFKTMHKFTTANGSQILIDGNYSIARAEYLAKLKDSTAKYIGIKIKY